MSTYRIAIASGKGGVGKSTVTVNLAHALKAQGLKVGILDADLYGPSQPILLDAKGEKAHITEKGEIHSIDCNGIPFISVTALMEDNAPLIWRAPMATKLISDFLAHVVWPELDFLLIDLPPGTGDIQITLAQRAELNAAIVVTTPQQVACQIAEKALQLFERVNVPVLGLVENMSYYTCDSCQAQHAIFKSGGGEALAEKHDVPLLGALPLDSAIVEHADNGSVFQTFSAALQQVYLDLATEVTQRIDYINQSPLEPLKISLKEQRLHLAWVDHLQAEFGPYNLRLACQCADCRDEHTGEARLDPSTVSPEIHILEVSKVGRYGLKIKFSDQHDTGIYSFEQLRSLCECPKCLAQ